MRTLWHGMAICLAGGLSLVLASTERADPPDIPQSSFVISERWATAGSPTVGGEFGYVAGMAEARDGMIWVSDGRLGQIVELSPSGTPTRRAARTGDGPGEVGSPGRIVRTLRDELAIHDLKHLSIELFAPDGRFVRRIRLPYPIDFLKGFTALPSGEFVLTGGIPGRATAIHRFGTDGRLKASWYPIPETTNARAGLLVAGGSVWADADGSLLFSQAAPLRIMLFPPGYPQSGREPSVLASDPKLVRPIGDDFIVERVEGGQWVRSFRWGAPMSRAVFRLDDGNILNVVVFAEAEEGSIWQLYDPSGRLLAQEESARAYWPWNLTEDGDVLASYIEPETSQHFAARLAMRWLSKDD